MKIDDLMKMGFMAFDMLQDKKVQSVIKFVQNFKKKKRPARARRQRPVMNARRGPRMQRPPQSSVHRLPQRRR